MSEIKITPELRAKLQAILSDYIKEKKMRQTPERVAILDKILDMDTHFSIDELYEVLEPEFHVSKATVYNTVELLCDCRILRKHFFKDNQGVYELCAYQHHHLVCSDCGGLRTVSIGAIDEYLGSIKVRGFDPDFSSLTIYGTCSPCSKKKRKTNKEK